MKYLPTLIKNVSVISTSILINIGIVFDVKAGPGLAFRYDYLGLNQSQCMVLASQALMETNLEIPNNVVNINNTAFVSGENFDLTVIIDCSEADINGRVTVMATHINNSAIALDLAEELLNIIGR